MTRSWAGAGAGVALALASLLASAPAPARADPADEALLLAHTAAARTQRRLGGLARSTELDGVARRHAERLAATPGPAFHNPALAGETPGWISVGEVVGRIDGTPGWEVRLQQRFLASATHRQVILSPAFTAIGVGTARTPDGVVNAVEVFGRAPGDRPPRPPRATRQQAAQPPPAVPTPPPPPPPPPPPSTASPPSPLPPPPTTTTTGPPLRPDLAGVSGPRPANVSWGLLAASLLGAVALYGFRTLRS